MSVRNLTRAFLCVLLLQALLLPVAVYLYNGAGPELLYWGVPSVVFSASAVALLRRIFTLIKGLSTLLEERGQDIDGKRKLAEELDRARHEAEESSAKLKKTISDLEEFALLAIRRELKMQELRELFVRLKDEHEIKREFPS